MTNANGARVTEPKQNGSKAGAPMELDPSKPTYMLVPASVMQDTIDIIKELPYDKVYRVMPHLVGAKATQLEEDESK